ncbi:hypothetical protein ACTMTJ_08070 [Phytohabitans sp. LJ34]|uniref:hypothetical protein n=1 Tax=Phytohabitans sp. LJ34 TaxID=3452217 RepID=UPI003F888DB8
MVVHRQSGPVPEPSRWRPRQSVRGVLGLVAAVGAAGVLVAQVPDRLRSPRPRPPAAEVVWPHAQRAQVPGVLSDGALYSPVYFLDERVSVGTASDPGGGEVRLVVRGADGAVHVLRRLPTAVAPRYAGFTPAGGQLVWAESVTGRDGTVRTELWRAGLPGGTPRKITGDTGRVAFFGSDYDIVVESGRLYWTAEAPGGQEATEVRSVPVGGGRVEVRTEPGTWTLSGWPWLASAGSSGRARLRSMDTAQVVTVDAAGDMLDRCGPGWCRVFVLSGDGPVRSELIRVDGSQRRRVADDGATAAIVDVAVLDRFEVLLAGSSTVVAANGGRRLLVYDLKVRRLISVADAVARVFYRGGVLWWSTAIGESIAWHTLDLRTV